MKKRSIRGRARPGAAVLLLMAGLAVLPLAAAHGQYPYDLLLVDEDAPVAGGGPGSYHSGSGAGMDAAGDGDWMMWSGDFNSVPGRMMLRRLQSLDLTSDQWNDLRRAHIESEMEVVELQADAQALRLDVHRMLMDEDPDLGAIRSALGEINDLRTEVQMRRIESMLGVRDVLTPQQLDRFLDPTWSPRSAVSDRSASPGRAYEEWGDEQDAREESWHGEPRARDRGDEDSRREGDHHNGNEDSGRDR